MRDSGSQDEREAKQIREWLLALLRFAFTLEPMDQAFVLSLADELDAFGCPPKRARLCFFFRTSAEVCAAIEKSHYPMRDLVLGRFLGRVGDRRLQEALRAAIKFKTSVTNASSMQQVACGAETKTSEGRSFRASGGGRRGRSVARTCGRSLPS